MGENCICILRGSVVRSINMADESPELKAGHAPATKVGGMRVVQHKTPKDEKDEKVDKKISPEDVEEFGEDKPVKKSSASSVMVSGAKASEEEAFPKEAVKVMHDKPMPTHDKGASHKPKI